MGSIFSLAAGRIISEINDGFSGRHIDIPPHSLDYLRLVGTYKVCCEASFFISSIINRVFYNFISFPLRQSTINLATLRSDEIAILQYDSREIGKTDKQRFLFVELMKCCKRLNYCWYIATGLLRPIGTTTTVNCMAMYFFIILLKVLLFERSWETFPTKTEGGGYCRMTLPLIKEEEPQVRRGKRRSSESSATMIETTP